VVSLPRSCRAAAGGGRSTWAVRVERDYDPNTRLVPLLEEPWSSWPRRARPVGTPAEWGRGLSRWGRTPGRRRGAELAGGRRTDGDRWAESQSRSARGDGPLGVGWTVLPSPGKRPARSLVGKGLGPVHHHPEARSRPGPRVRRVEHPGRRSPWSRRWEPESTVDLRGSQAEVQPESERAAGRSV